MTPTWYVTFEVRSYGVLPKRRSPRETRTFVTEDDAKLFARVKFVEGAVVFAGTIHTEAGYSVIVHAGMAG